MSDIYLILHNVRSLHNVGSIFRTADAAGVKKIYLTGYTPLPYDFFGKLHKDFAKTALGAEKYILWEQRRNISGLLKSLRKGGEVFVVSLEQSPRAIPYNKLTTTYRSKLKKYDSISLIVGNEIRGLSRAILKKSDAVVEIPMYGRKESLNVAVAAGIVLFSLREQFGHIQVNDVLY